MRVQLSVSVGVVQPVHDSVSPGAHIVRALCDVGEDEEKLFPALAHPECPVRCIPVVEECLREKG